MRTVIHVTHEAVVKIGGIGAVLEGLITSQSYSQAVNRTILVGPLFDTESPLSQRLGPDGNVLYSSVDNVTGSAFSSAFHRIEQEFNVRIVYGHRRFTHPATNVKVTPEVLLIDVRRAKERKTGHFKKILWDHFGIASDRYEHAWEYEEYVRLAWPALEAVRAIGAGVAHHPAVVIGHEFMGMPTALGAKAMFGDDFRTIFHAHEVAPMRRIVEGNTGHDTMFYSVLHQAAKEGQYVEDVFGQQNDYHKYALVEAAKYCDNVLAVGDQVVDELRFLSRDFSHVDIDLAYNGIPAWELPLSQRKASRDRLQRYCQNLLGYKPDYVFTHVTRTALSKGIWRDTLVLDHIERAFHKTGRTAVLLLLTCDMPQRTPEQVWHMEKWWSWPLAHRECAPDLSGGEAMAYSSIQAFNTRSRNVKTIMINQFGLNPEIGGTNVPADMDFWDMRTGSDLEFGMAVYEPFGISPLEPLAFGAVCVISSVCGCAGFVNRIVGNGQTQNVVIADYSDLDQPELSAKELATIDRQQRNEVELRVARRTAERILRCLPENPEQIEQMLASGYELASHMTWDVVASQYILPGIERACSRRRVAHAAS